VEKATFANGGAGCDDGSLDRVPRASHPFHVKICGVTTAADAAAVAAAGADEIGLNFVAGSPRRLDVAAAREVAAAVPAGVLRVGVFAGLPPEEILAVVAAVGLDAVQLHGHLEEGSGAAGPVDPPATAAALRGVPVIRAVRLEADGLASARRWLDAARALGPPVVAALVDAGGRDASGAALGGTGRVVDWGALAAAEPLVEPVVLAGGLTPGNVAAAIRATGVAAVDTASGVESAPGIKDPAKVRQFVAAARAALGLPTAGGVRNPADR
jgi:phosphoribosylanthranilate isomerase